MVILEALVQHPGCYGVVASPRHDWVWTTLAWLNQGSRTRSTSRRPTLLPFPCRLSRGPPSYLSNVAAAVLTMQFAFPAIKIVCDPRVNDPVISIYKLVLVSISFRHLNRLLNLA